jgi:membrane protease subunit HflC
MERELKRIRSGAYRTAQEIRGAADSTATRVYARAYNADPQFYSFLKTLETYPETFGEKETLVLSTDGEFYRFLTEGVR